MLATDERFRIFKLFSFETRTIKRPVCFLRTHHYWEISTAVVLKPDSLKCKHLKTEIHNNCHASIQTIHPNTEFFSQGILSISLAGLLSGSVEAGCDERRFNPLILIFNWAEDTKTNSVLPVQPGPGGGAWTSAVATPAQLSSSVAATRESDTRGQSSHQMLASHWSPGAVLASDWLMGWHQSPWVPDPRWEEIGQRWDAARDNKISPSGRECNAQYTVQCLYCSPLGNIPWLLQIFMASLNTNTMCYNQLYLLWWLMGPNAKWSWAGGRGLTLYTVWSLVTGWIEVMNFKTCLNLLQISLFLYLQTLVFLPCTTSSPSWEVSLRIVSKVHWKVLRSF